MARYLDYESLKELYDMDTEALVKAREKTEVVVAREIFEEAEKFLDQEISFYEDKKFTASLGFDKEFYRYCDYMLAKIEQYKEKLAELKKKYAPKECPSCKHFASCEPSTLGSCDQYEEEVADDGR
jgi:hypothetical protein